MLSIVWLITIKEKKFLGKTLVFLTLMQAQMQHRPRHLKNAKSICRVIRNPKIHHLQYFQEEKKQVGVI